MLVYTWWWEFFYTWLGKCLLFISEDLQTRRCLLSTSRHFLTNSRLQWTTAKCSQQLLGEGQSRRTKRQEVNVPLGAEAWPLPFHAGALPSDTAKAVVSSLSTATSVGLARGLRAHMALAFWLREDCPRPGQAWARRTLPVSQKPSRRKDRAASIPSRLCISATHPYGCLEEDLFASTWTFYFFKQCESFSFALPLIPLSFLAFLNSSLLDL